MRPIRRTTRLVIRNVDEQSIVYDLDNAQVTCLDPSTSAVFAVCTGTDLAGLVQATGLEESVVAASLIRLTDAGLLHEPSVSRRALVKRWGSAAALAPLITIAAPAAMAAASVNGSQLPSVSFIKTCSTIDGSLTYTVALSGFSAGQQVTMKRWNKADSNGQPVSVSSVTMDGTGSATPITETVNPNGNKSVTIQVYVSLSATTPLAVGSLLLKCP